MKSIEKILRMIDKKKEYDSIYFNKDSALFLLTIKRSKFFTELESTHFVYLYEIKSTLKLLASGTITTDNEGSYLDKYQLISKWDIFREAKNKNDFFNTIYHFNNKNGG